MKSQYRGIYHVAEAFSVAKYDGFVCVGTGDRLSKRVGASELGETLAATHSGSRRTSRALKNMSLEQAERHKLVSWGEVASPSLSRMRYGPPSLPHARSDLVIPSPVSQDLDGCVSCKARKFWCGFGLR